MKLIITGATGLIGAETVRQALADPAITEVMVLVRNKPELQHGKLTTVIHTDFTNYKGLEIYFDRADALIWCLGISQTQVSKEQYHAITYDYVKACADFCQAIHPQMRFVFVSGDGADRSEISRTLFRRIKGKAENTLLASGLKDLFIARPDAVRPRHKNKKAPFVYKLAYPFFPLVEWLAPHKIIWSDVLGRALVSLAKNGALHNTLENVELRQLGASKPGQPEAGAN